MSAPPARPAIHAADVRAHTGRRWPLPGAGRTLERWRLLADVAADDLPLAKLVEPHHDAVAILAELGGPAPAPDEIWAIWAAEPPFAVVTATPADDGRWRLDGTKAFCSGAAVVSHALVTAEAPDGPRLFAVRLDDGAWTERAGHAWRGAGMSRAGTRTLDLDDVVATAVGGPGDYVDRPGFWAGAIGVAACWLGGAYGVAETLEAAADRLDAHGLAHLGAVRAALDASDLVLEAAAARLDGSTPGIAEVQRLASSVRVQAAATVDEVVDRVGRALGPAPLAFDGRHAEHVADLQVFVRQHHAERDLEGLGRLPRPDGGGGRDA